ncbi:MAG: DUF1549 domain-containing protein [Verrucomicrobiales bacterium]|nr:DUF1549 domain-containing protein [Verrucomicrobiales bacterium]
MKCSSVIVIFLFLSHPSYSKSTSSIDDILAASRGSNQTQPIPRASDEVFLRRIYLDVTGRIPAFEEARIFLESNDPDKRSQLIDELLYSEGYVNHFFHFWADILRIHSRQGGGKSVTPYYVQFVRDSLRENTPYDEFVYTLVTAQGEASVNGAIGYTYRDKGMPLDHLANTMRIFTGTRLVCAQCHNHPFDKWTQMDFYQMAAFTYGMDVNNRSFRTKFTEAQRSIAKLNMNPQEKSALQGAFRDVMRGIPTSSRAVSYDSGKLPKLPHDYKYDDGDPRQKIHPTSLFGEDYQLQNPAQGLLAFADWLCSPDNPRFTTVVVNRLWKKVMGRGLIEPVDEIVDLTEASHPELLAALERLMVEGNYDMKVFLKMIFNSKVYQREACRQEIAPEEKYHFPGPLLRRMSAEQIWDSVVTLINPSPETGDWKKYQEIEIELAHGRAIRDTIGSFEAEGVLGLAKAVASLRAYLGNRKSELTKQLNAARKARDNQKVAELSAEFKHLQTRQRQTIHHLIYQPELRVGKTDELMLSFPNGDSEAVLMTDIISSKGRINVALLRKLQTRKEAEILEQGFKEEGIDDRAEKRNYLASTKIIRAAHLGSPAPIGHFLRAFGQSDRILIENAVTGPAVPQKLEMMNGTTFGELATGNSVFARKLKKQNSIEDKIDFIFLSLLSRYPSVREQKWIVALKQDRGENAVEDLIFALLNSTEFLFVK